MIIYEMVRRQDEKLSVLTKIRLRVERSHCDSRGRIATARLKQKHLFIPPAAFFEFFFGEEVVLAIRHRNAGVRCADPRRALDRLLKECFAVAKPDERFGIRLAGNGPQARPCTARKNDWNQHKGDRLLEGQ